MARLDVGRFHVELTDAYHRHGGAPALAEFHGYSLFDTLHRINFCLLLAHA